MLGVLNNSQIDQVLSGQMTGRIGCAADGKVYIVPITYAYDGMDIFGHSMEGMKINMMRKNPKVCFEVEDFVSITNWRSVIVWGEFMEITTEPEREKAMEFFTEKIKPYKASEAGKPPDSLSNAPHIVEKAMRPIVFKIRVTEKSGRFER